MVGRVFVGVIDFLPHGSQKAKIPNAEDDPTEPDGQIGRQRGVAGAVSLSQQMSVTSVSNTKDTNGLYELAQAKELRQEPITLKTRIRGGMETKKSREESQRRVAVL